MAVSGRRRSERSARPPARGLSHQGPAAQQGTGGFRRRRPTFADGGRHSFDRARSHVADSKEPRDGCLVREGERASRHESQDAASAPVYRKPCGSRSTSAGSQSVRGLAPIMTNRLSRGSCCCCPVLRSRSVTRSSCPSPCPPTTSVFKYTLIIGCAAMALTKYADMLSARFDPRTIMCTDAQYLARCRAAWPAELPAPITPARSPVSA